MRGDTLPGKSEEDADRKSNVVAAGGCFDSTEPNEKGPLYRCTGAL